jgi:hypothetical protein
MREREQQRELEAIALKKKSFWTVFTLGVESDSDIALAFFCFWMLMM